MFTELWGPIPMVFAVGAVVIGAQHLHRSANVTVVVVAGVVAAVLAMAALWPVRTLAITGWGLRFRELRAPQGRSTRLREVRWPEVAEVIVASRNRTATIGIVSVAGTSLVWLPARGLPAVTAAIARLSPGTVV